jgi:hypothetical protein
MTLLKLKAFLLNLQWCSIAILKKLVDDGFIERDEK